MDSCSIVVVVADVVVVAVRTNRAIDWSHASDTSASTCRAIVVDPNAVARNSVVDARESWLTTWRADEWWLMKRSVSWLICERATIARDRAKVCCCDATTTSSTSRES